MYVRLLCSFKQSLHRSLFRHFCCSFPAPSESKSVAHAQIFSQWECDPNALVSRSAGQEERRLWERHWVESWITFAHAQLLVDVLDTNDLVFVGYSFKTNVVVLRRTGHFFDENDWEVAWAMLLVVDCGSWTIWRCWSCSCLWQVSKACIFSFYCIFL